ncbi:hypothetical protein [Vreelandella aquamarina]|uniref:Uncharacterized protein n=1 Tax=Vreelandella aquamarina TaxID=77097 RepID=A0A857GLG9_9GAMM|nr:hypothetical protein [Halomonas meridiana]QHD50055.1 hypothetical protein CTT34_10315 [Halomonas meridiana]
MANPTFEGIRLAIERRLASWDGAPVEYDGAQQSPALKAAIEAKQSWVRCTIQHGDSFAPYKGASTRRSPDRLDPVPSLYAGTTRVLGLPPCSQTHLPEHFQFYRDAGLELLTASVQRVGPENGWYMYLVSLPWRAG